MNDNAKAWVAALRSGEYSQGKHALRTDEGFCCLGVACDISGLGEWNERLGFEWEQDGEGYEEQSLLPNHVMEWLGLTSHDGTINDMTTLASKNDKGWTFAEIADVIEENAGELFCE